MSLSFSTNEYDLPVTPYRNELKWSNGFGNAAWNKTNITAVVSDVAPPPDYGPVAWLVTGFAGTLVKLLYQQANIAAVPGQWRCDWVVYAGTLATVAVVMEDGTGSNSLRRKFNVSTGAASGAGVSGGTATGADGEIVALGGGWYRVSAWGTFVTASTLIRAILYLDDYSPSATTGTIHVAACDLYRGITFRPHIETETVPLRSDQVIARAITPHNLIGYSNTLSNAYWTKTRASIGGTITLNDGALNGWGGAVLSKIVEDSTASNTHFINNTVDSIVGNPASLVSVRFLFACRASPSRRLEARLYGDVSGNYAYYRINPDTGAVSTSAVVGTASLHSCTVTQVDTLTIDGDASRPIWEVVMRLWPTTTSDTAAQNLYFFLDSGGSLTYTGDGTSGVYVGKIQVVNGYTLPDYVDTTTATTPFTSTISAATLNGVSQAIAGNNLLTYSEEFSNAAWIKHGPSTVSQGQADPYGGTTAWRLTRATGVASYLQQSLALSAGTYTLQVKAKAATTGNYFAMRIQGTYPNRGDVIFNLSAGTITGAATAAGTASAASATITALANSYYLCTLTITLADALTVLLFGPCTSSAAVASWEGSSATASDVDITEAAIHSGAVAEYVKTGSTAAYVLDKSSAIVTMPTSSGYAYDTMLVTVTDGSTSVSGTLGINNLNRLTPVRESVKSIVKSVIRKII